MKVPICQENFFSNRSNKNRFISTLIKKLENVNIISKQAQDDADVLIIETTIEEACRKKRRFFSYTSTLFVAKTIFFSKTR